MKQQKYPPIFTVRSCLVIIASLFFHQITFSKDLYQPGPCPEFFQPLESTSDSSTCSSFPYDTITGFARFDHVEDGHGFYMVRLTMLHSDFERLSFYEEARASEFYMKEKGEFRDDSALFTTTISNQDIAIRKFEEFYHNAVAKNASTSDSDKKKIIDNSPFFTIFGTTPNPQIQAPLAVVPCTSAFVSCTGTIYSFPAAVSGTAPPVVGGYPNYGCLGSEPFPTWTYMQVGVAGDIIILIQQSGGNDVDFICWGPFTSLTDGCATGLTGTCNPVPTCCTNTNPGCTNFYPRGNMVDCSFSPAATETCHILNAQVGDIYILLITNFSQAPGTLTFHQTGGTGVTNCNIVVHCSMIDITATPTACNSATNTFNVSGNMEFSNPPPTGTLTITDITAVPQIFQTFTAPFTSPHPYSLANIPCDGATHTLTAVFSDSTACTLSQTFTAPAASCPSAQISGGGNICNDGSSTTTVDIALTGVGPFNFTYAINGVSQTPVVGYIGPSPYVITTLIPGTYTLVSVSNSVCLGSGPVSGSAVVALNSLPVPLISGVSPVCAGSAGNIYMTQAGNQNYLWTISAGGVITSGGTTSSNSVTITWNTPGSQIVSVNYTDANECTAALPTVYNVTVNPLPVPTISGNNNPCAGSTGNVYSTEGGKSNYQWAISAGGTVTGGGTPTDSTITITWNMAGARTVSVHYQPAPGCTTSLPTVYNVTVKPLPVITNASLVDSICSATAPSILITTSIPGCTFTWTAVNSVGNITGFSASGASNPISETLTNTLFTLGEVTYTVIPSVNGCSGASKDFRVEVKPTPDAYFQPSSDTICSAQTTSTVILSHVAGTLFVWTASGSLSVSGYSKGFGSSIVQTLHNSDVIEGTATYSVTPTAATCTGTQYTTTITVFPLAAVSFSACTDTMTTTNAKPILLKGGLPLFGTYSGAGVNSAKGSFTPSVAGTGIHIITYTYINRYACPNQATMRIRVMNAGAFTCGNNLTDIRDIKVYPTVQIGSQCWMAAYLNYGTMINSTVVQRDNCQVEKYCFNESLANCGLYGGLYQWDEMMQYQEDESLQGFCPPGWHVPAESEWNTLFNFYFNNGFAAAALKSTGYSGFNAFVKGTNFYNRSWNFFDFATMIWSSTSHGPTKAWAHGMNEPDPSASFYPASRSNAFQIRCLKD